MNSKRCHNLTAASCGVLNPTANKAKTKMNTTVIHGLLDCSNPMICTPMEVLE
jgi:hypothetical protein